MKLKILTIDKILQGCIIRKVQFHKFADKLIFINIYSCDNYFALKY